MNYICYHEKPKYRLNYPCILVDNNDTSFQDNIASYGNRYRHLRGIYNIWKNFDLPDTIGVFQQKRYMGLNVIPFGFRCVVADWGLGRTNIRHQYRICHFIEDLELVEKIIGPEFTEYIDLQVMPYFHNMFIFNKLDFCNYCEFLFNVLEKFEELSNHIQREGYQEAVCAFLAERIGSYWISRNISENEIYLTKTLEVF